MTKVFNSFSGISCSCVLGLSLFISNPVLAQNCNVALFGDCNSNSNSNISEIPRFEVTVWENRNGVLYYELKNLRTGERVFSTWQQLKPRAKEAITKLRSVVIGDFVLTGNSYDDGQAMYKMGAGEVMQDY